MPLGAGSPQGPQLSRAPDRFRRGKSLKSGNVLAVLVVVFVLCVACSLWFRADSVDAGITDQQVDSLGAIPSTPDSLGGDSLEVPEEPPLLMNYPPEPVETAPVEEGTE